MMHGAEIYYYRDRNSVWKNEISDKCWWQFFNINNAYLRTPPVLGNGDFGQKCSALCKARVLFTEPQYMKLKLFL